MPSRIPALLFIFFLTGCQSENQFEKFTQSLGSPHDYIIESDLPELLKEPIRPLPTTLELNQQKVALGAKLFHDTRLSGDNSISCASCHNLSNGGDDDSITATGVGGVKGPINSPTVLNSGFNFLQFWNGRATSLKKQAAGPVHNPIEMASNWEEVIGKIGDDVEYINAFQEIYGEQMSGDHITDSIAEFERSLLTYSPFDKYLRGDKSAVSQQAQHGYGLFKKYGCVSCHQGVGVGGNLFQRFGALVSYYQDKEVKDVDYGRAEVTKNSEDMHVFKVPSLRNVARTAPYFHNGSADKLEDAIQTMAQLQLGRTIPAQDIASIKAFLESLSGNYL